MNETVSPFGEIFDKTPLDDLLADYLDAELCKAVGSVTADSTPGQGIVSELLGRCDVKDKKQEIKGVLVSIRDEFLSRTFSVEKYPRTSLAIARISLFGGYFKARGEPANKIGDADTTGGNKTASVPSQTDSSHGGLNDREWNRLFQEFPDMLLEAVPADHVDSGASPPGTPGQDCQFDQRQEDRQFDRLRTQWQQIHYLACDGLPIALPDRVKRVNEIYQETWQETAQVIQKYLQCQMTTDADQRRYLRVDSDWLISWLVSNVLLSRKLRKYYDLEKPSQPSGGSVVNPVTKMRYMMYLSHLILYVIHCARHYTRQQVFKGIKNDKYYKEFQRPPFADVPTGLTLSRSRSQIYILSEYAYREIGVHRELRVFEQLVRQLGYELPLYAASSSYRDHLYHVMDVCLLGELLLRSNIRVEGRESQQTALVKYMADLIKKDDSHVFENWYVAALYHDLGYVVEQADKFLAPIEAINGSGLDDFTAQAKRGLESGKAEIAEVIKWGIALQKRPLAEELKKVESTDHGIVGWLHLQHLLKDLDDQIDQLDPALQAILRHNLPDQKVHVKEEPISMLLMFCDHVQEWGRPRVGPDPLAQEVMEALRFSELSALKQKIRVHDLLVGGLEPIPQKPQADLERVCDNCAIGGENCISCMRVRTQITGDKLTCRLPHIDSREGDFEPGISWLLFCRDLQCLNFEESNWPFKIDIVLEHTPPRIWRILPWHPLEMDLLEEYANSQPQATYLCQWIEFARQPESEAGISYKNDEGDPEGGIGKETFTIELTELKRPLKRGLSDDVWKKFYTWKWRWLGQRLLNASLGSWPDTD